MAAWSTFRWVNKTTIPPLSVLCFCSCDKVYYKHVVRFRFYLLTPGNVIKIHWIQINHVQL